MLFSYKNELRNKETRLHGVLSLITSAFSFSLMTVCVKLLNGRIPVMEIIFVRALISLVITRAMLKRKEISPWGTNRFLLLLRGMAGTGALFCIFKSLSTLPLATATIIQYSYPTFTALIAWKTLGEKLNNKIFLGILLSWTGIHMIIQPIWDEKIIIGFSSIYSITIALLGALLTAIAYVMVRILTKKEDDLVIIQYFPLVSVPIALPFVIYEGVLPNPIDWILICGVGIFTQIGQICITRGLKLLPAGQASSINYLQVLFATLWGATIFSEPFDFYSLAGAMCVLVGTLMCISYKSDLVIKS